MHSKTVLSFLFATAAIAAPILEGVLPVAVPDLPVKVPDLPVIPDLSLVTDLTKELDVSKLTKGLSLPVRRGLPPDLDITKKLPLNVPSLPVDTKVVPDLSKRLLGLENILKSVNTLLNDVLSLSKKVEADLLSLIGHLEDVNVQGVFTDAYSILNALVAKVHKVLKAQDADVDLSSVQPIISTITKELNSLAAEVQQLLDAGVVGDLIDEIKSTLDDVIRLVEKLTGDEVPK